MRFYNQNFHPTGPWVRVLAEFRGKGSGRCVSIELQDESTSISLNLHYGENDPVEFVEELKGAVARLRVPPEEVA